MVSRLALGTMTFGLRCDEATSRRIFDAGLAAGITLVDTADVYPYAGDLSTVGITERLIGKWLRGRRDDIVLATKVGGQMGADLADSGNSARHIRNATNASLARLDTEVIDILQLHGFDADVRLDETAEELAALVDEGRVKYVGASNFEAGQVRDFAAALEKRGVPLTVQQPRYSLLARGIEREILPTARELGIGTLAYNPLAGGMLSGAHHRGSSPTGRFAFGGAAATYRARYWQDDSFDALDAIGDVAHDTGLAMPVLAMSWALVNEDVDALIVGASAPEHVASAVAALDVVLAREVIDRLNEITQLFRLTEGVNSGLPHRQPSN